MNGRLYYSFTWTAEIAQWVKYLHSNHGILDSVCTEPWREEVGNGSVPAISIARKVERRKPLVLGNQSLYHGKLRKKRTCIRRDVNST